MGKGKLEGTLVLRYIEFLCRVFGPLEISAADRHQLNTGGGSQVGQTTTLTNAATTNQSNGNYLHPNDPSIRN